MSQMTAPKISVLGDGISSFEGYVPRQASFYSPSYVSYSGFDSPEDKSQRDYREMLDSLKKFHPDAQIWVGTIVVGKECEPYYLDPVPLKTRGEYNAIIHQCVEEAGDRVHLVDLSSIDGVYETVNGTHPNKKGMTTFAQAWYEAMKDSI